jgi:hypothetical protein
MPRARSSLEIAAGKLISAIQREWSAEAGELSASASEEVMHSSHALLAAAKGDSLALLSEPAQYRITWGRNGSMPILESGLTFKFSSLLP